MAKCHKLLHQLKSYWHLLNRSFWKELEWVSMWITPKVMPPIISMGTRIYAKRTITLFNRVNPQLQNTIFQCSHNHWLCIFTSNEQDPACHACNNVHLWRWLTVIVTTAETHHMLPHCSLICMEEFNDSPLLHTHFYVRRHFVTLSLCCHLSHSNNNMWWNVVGKIRHLLLYHHHLPLMLWANIRKQETLLLEQHSYNESQKGLLQKDSNHNEEAICYWECIPPSNIWDKESSKTLLFLVLTWKLVFPCRVLFSPNNWLCEWLYKKLFIKLVSIYVLQFLYSINKQIQFQMLYSLNTISKITATVSNVKAFRSALPLQGLMCYCDRDLHFFIKNWKMKLQSQIVWWNLLSLSSE